MGNKRLTDTECRQAKPREKKYRMADERTGLALWVMPNGSKLWQMRVTIDGKRSHISIGRYPEVSLAAARDQATAGQTIRARGGDPATATPSSSGAVVDRERLFKVCADKWHQHMAANGDWVPEHASRVWGRISRDLFPAIGDMAVDEITTRHMKEAIQAVEARGAIDLAKRVRQAADQIFEFAEVDLGITLHNPATKKLNRVLKKAPPVSHHKALPEKMIPDLYQRLRKYRGRRQTALSVELMLHVPLRTSEMRWGRWSEIKRDTWTIPADRDDAPTLNPRDRPLGMKQRRAFTTPLPPRALEILAELRKIAGDSEWILPAVGGDLMQRDRSRPPLTLTGVVHRWWIRDALMKMGLSEYATPHGFRGTFSTAMNERKAKLGFDKDWIEFQLAHIEGSKVREAYNSAEYLEGRRAMMLWWSEFLEHQKETADLIS